MVEKRLKKTPFFIIAVIVVALVLNLARSAGEAEPVAENKPVEIGPSCRLFISSNIVNSRPFDIGTEFPNDTGSVFFSLSCESAPRKEKTVIFNIYQGALLHRSDTAWVSAGNDGCHIEVKTPFGPAGDWSVDAVLKDNTLLASKQFTMKERTE
ncbi:MAG: hypothetical protein ACLFQK_08935 [Fibrobacterota bacterium]